MDSFIAPRQEGTMKDYCEAIKRLFNQGEIEEGYAIYLFIDGLKPEISEFLIQWHQYSLQNLEDAFALAELREDLIKLDSIQGMSSDSEVTIYIPQQTCSYDISIGNEKVVESPCSSQFIEIEHAPQVFGESPKILGNNIQELIDGYDSNKSEKINRTNNQLQINVRLISQEIRTKELIFVFLYGITNKDFFKNWKSKRLWPKLLESKVITEELDQRETLSTCKKRSSIIDGIMLLGVYDGMNKKLERSITTLRDYFKNLHGDLKRGTTGVKEVKWSDLGSDFLANNAFGSFHCFFNGIGSAVSFKQIHATFEQCQKRAKLNEMVNKPMEARILISKDDKMVSTMERLTKHGC